MVCIYRTYARLSLVQQMTLDRDGMVDRTHPLARACGQPNREPSTVCIYCYVVCLVCPVSNMLYQNAHFA